MKKILLTLFIFSFAYSQNGVRSLNGSLNGSQRIVWDTTGTPNTFKITTSNGVHTLWFPYNRFALMGQGSVGNADSLGGVPASDYLTWGDTSSVLASKAYSNGRYVQSVSGTSPIVSSGGLTPTISFAPASGSSFDSTRIAYVDKANTFTGTPQTMGKAVIDTLIASPQHILEVGVSGREYTSIQTAINAFTYGDVIVVYAGTYSDNLTISDSGVTIVGLDNKNTRISGTVSITGKDCQLINLRFDNTFTLNCQSAYSLHKWSQFTDCIYSDDVFIGSSTVENVYSWDFDNCNFIGYQDTLLINQTGAWEAHTVFQNGYIFSDTGGTEPYGGGYNLMLYSGGYIQFYKSQRLLFESINFDCTDSTIVLGFDQCQIVLIGSGNINASNNSTNFAVLSMNYGLIGNWNNSNTWTFSNKFELDFRYCSLSIPNIVWNSTGASRWENCEQRPYGSTATLTGTGLSKLYLTYNIFRMDAPTGLGANAGNRWGAYIDD